MNDLNGFRTSIGACRITTRALGFSITEADSVDLAIDSSLTMPGVNIYIQQIVGPLTGLPQAVIYLNEEQLLQVAELINLAIRVNAYGKGIAEMGGM